MSIHELCARRSCLWPPLFLVVACGRGPQPEFTPSSKGAEVVAAPEVAPSGIKHQRIRITDTDVDAEVFVVALDRFRLVGLNARTGERTGARVDVLRQEHDALVAVNGTFFADDGAPMGLLRQGGEEISSLRNADWGVLEVDARGHARLVHTRDYTPSPKAEFAVQCGPRVVIGGEVPGLKPQVAPRTALCVRTESEVALLVTRGSVQADVLGRWLATAESEGGLGCSDALLLDGGPSTQVSASFGGQDVELFGGWGVPNGVGVVAR